jgi:futalosine hydrolase
MSLKILYVTATPDEAVALKNIQGIKTFTEGFLFNGHEIRLLISGVGSMSASWAMTKWLSVNPKPDLAINAGIAGSFRADIIDGDVVIPVSDCFADAGIESDDGFITLAEAGLENGDKFPFRGGRIVAENKFSRMAAQLLKPVKAVTVNTATGSAATASKLAARFDPDIETMEGAAFFYICSRENIPFLAIRAISNRVGPRDKSKWNIPFALENLSEKLNRFFSMLHE